MGFGWSTFWVSVINFLPDRKLWRIVPHNFLISLRFTAPSTSSISMKILFVTFHVNLNKKCWKLACFHPSCSEPELTNTCDYSQVILCQNDFRLYSIILETKSQMLVGVGGFFIQCQRGNRIGVVSDFHIYSVLLCIKTPQHSPDILNIKHKWRNIDQIWRKAGGKVRLDEFLTEYEIRELNYSDHWGF